MILFLLLSYDSSFHLFELDLSFELINFTIIEMAVLILVNFDLELEEIFLLFEVEFALTNFENLAT